MSEETGNGSHRTDAVLLPAARVALHVKDAEIREAAKSLASDWRFARIVFDINDGSIETAIPIYETTPSPDLVIVETSTIEDGFTDRLEILAGNCAANTSAVVVGPVNDVYLYRKLIDMGVSDYLVRPVTRDVLTQVISKTLIEKFGAPDSRLIAVAGAKGGTGASTVAEELARTISTRLDEKTIILDAAGGWSYLAVAMGTEPMTSFTEITRLASGSDEAAFKRMIYNVSDKLSVLATGADAMLEDHTAAESFEGVVNRLMVTYPVVVVDLSGASAQVKKSVMARAHEILVVSTPTLSSLRAARTLMQEIKNFRGESGEHINFILNKTGEASGQEVGKADIEKVMDRKPGLTIPYDPKLFYAAETSGKSIQTVKGGEAIAGALHDLAKKLVKAKHASETKTGDTKANSFLSRLTGRKG